MNNDNENRPPDLPNFRGMAKISSAALSGFDATPQELPKDPLWELGLNPMTIAWITAHAEALGVDPHVFTAGILDQFVQFQVKGK